MPKAVAASKCKALPLLAHRVDSLRCEGSDAIGAKRIRRERRERVDLTKMTHLGPRRQICFGAQHNRVRLFGAVLGAGATLVRIEPCRLTL